MRAAVFHAAQDVRIEEVPEPEPQPGQVKLRNAFVGICGTDLHLYYEPEAAGVDLSKPHPLTGEMPPVILGHEFSGTVVGVGEGVEDLQLGDRVAVWPVVYCGRCRACELGMFQLCPDVAWHGINTHGGGLATFTTVSSGQCHKLPPSVDLRLGALVEPMAVGWHAVRLSGIAAGQSALILGAGPIGISLVFALRARGVDRILVSEPSALRRETMALLGVTQIVDPITENLGTWVGSCTGGGGVDYIFDAAGVAIALTEALPLLGPGGTAVIVGIHSQDIRVHPVSLVVGEHSLMGSLAYTHQDFVEVIEMMAQGVYDTTGWVEEVGLDQYVPTIQRMKQGSGVKAIVNVSD